MRLEKKQLINELCKNVKYYTISLSKAFDLKLLPEPSLVIHKIHLSDFPRKLILDYCWLFYIIKQGFQCLKQK